MKKIIFIIVLLLSNSAFGAGTTDDSKDSLYKQAKKIILKAKKFEKKDKMEKSFKIIFKGLR